MLIWTPLISRCILYIIYIYHYTHHHGVKRYATFRASSHHCKKWMSAICRSIWLRKKDWVQIRFRCTPYDKRNLIEFPKSSKIVFENASIYFKLNKITPRLIWVKAGGSNIYSALVHYLTSWYLYSSSTRTKFK